MKKAVLISIPLLALLAGAAAGWFSYYQRGQRQQEITLQEKIRALSEENKVLARNLQAMKLLAGRDAIQKRIEREVVQLRGLPFNRPVTYRRITRAELPGYMAREIRSEYTEDEFKDYLRSLAVMGFLPLEGDHEKMILDLLGEQVAAFYDPKQGELYTFETFDPERMGDQIIYAHEITHALQDQHFGLRQNTPILRKDDDDRVAAARALIEGDATLLMNLYLQSNFDPVQFFSRDLFQLLGQPVDKLAAVPVYLRGSLLFAYQQGQVFCERLYEEGGFAAVDGAYKRLPESTEQILHPEKYLQNSDPPVTVPIASLPFEGWKKIGDNVAGELGIRLLLLDKLDEAESVRAAEGWGGDRFQVFETGPGAHATVWMTVWDTGKDAGEFLNAYVAWFAKRKNLPPVEQSGNNDAFLFSCEGRQQTFTRKGRTVAVLDVPSAKQAEQILKTLWQNPLAK